MIEGGRLARLRTPTTAGDRRHRAIAKPGLRPEKSRCCGAVWKCPRSTRFMSMSRCSRPPCNSLNHFASDLRASLGAVGCDLEGNPRAVHTPQLPPFGKQARDESRKSSDLATEKAGKDFRLCSSARSSTKMPAVPLRLSRPYVAFPSSYPDEVQTIEIDIAVVALPDVPESSCPPTRNVWPVTLGITAVALRYQLVH